MYFLTCKIILFYIYFQSVKYANHFHLTKYSIMPMFRERAALAPSPELTERLNASADFAQLMYIRLDLNLCQLS